MVVVCLADEAVSLPVNQAQLKWPTSVPVSLIGNCIEMAIGMFEYMDECSQWMFYRIYFYDKLLKAHFK